MSVGNNLSPIPGTEALSRSSDDASSPQPSAKAGGSTSLKRLGFGWSPPQVQQVGFGAVAWFAVAPAIAGLGPWSGGRALRIGETGQVPEVEVENLSDTPLLVPAHLVITGGWQTRAVERSVVVPARASVRVPVKCVEAGRWAPRDDKSGATFHVAERTGVRTRWSTSHSMAEQLARHGRFAAEQSAVWQHIEEELTRTPEPSHTRSYEAYLHGVKKRSVDAAHRAGVRPPSVANAVIVFPPGGGFWFEAYATSEALDEQADDLLADLFEPARSFTAPAVGAQDASRTGSESVDALLRALWVLPLREVDRVQGTLGTEHAIVSGELAAGERAPLLAATEAMGAIVTVDGLLAHIAVGGSPRHAEGELGADGPGAAGVLPSQPPVDAQMPTTPDAIPLATAPETMPPPPPEPKEVRHSSSSSSSSPSSSSSERGQKGGVVINLRPPKAPPPTPAVVQPAPRISLEEMRTIYARARDLLPEDPPAPEAVRGYRLMRVLDGNLCWLDVQTMGDGYAVLGSHDRCDLVLAGDDSIWLRHLVATCVRLEDGNIGLRLIDLKTDVPFFLEDESPQWSGIARGSFAMRLGRHVLCGFPIGAAPEETRHLTQAGFADAAAGKPRATVATASIADMDAIPVDRSRSFREMPYAMTPSAPVSQIHDLMGPSPSPRGVRVTLERGGMGASVEIPTEALDNGVLLGRALNCFDGGLRRVLCDAVSRAHVLLLRDADEVYALDLCTTNGTRVSGRRIRRHRLSTEGTTLELGKKVTFRWHRRRPVEPQD